MTTLKTDKIRLALGESVFSKNIVFQKTMDSTNTHAKALANRGAPEGTIVLTELQTGGRGRMGRRWHSPGYVNLLFSVLIRPRMKVEDVFCLSMAFALAACEAVEEVCSLRAMIKWPNDIYLFGKKLGGMLTEFSVVNNHVDYVILGLGLNVNWNPGEDDTPLYVSTSISAETGRYIEREQLLVALLNRFEKYYVNILGGNFDEVYRAWNERSLLLKKTVNVQTTEGRIRGKAVRIDRTGALVIEGENGKEQRVLNGDVSITGIDGRQFRTTSN